MEDFRSFLVNVENDRRSQNDIPTDPIKRKRWYIDIYLRSPHWKNVKATVLNRDEHQCKHCGNKNSLHVHHHHYRYLYGELEHLECVVTLCSSCHEKVHGR